MTWNFPPYSSVFFLGTVLANLLAVVVLRKNRAPGFIVLALIIMAAGEWSLTRAFEAGAIALSAKIFWGKTEFFGILSICVLWLIFAMEYVGITSWRRRQYLALLWTIPVVTLALVWTNEWHGLIWPSITVSPDDSSILIWSHGTWFWFAAVFNYIAVLAGVILLIRHAIGQPGFYRRQIFLLLTATAIPLIGNTIYLAGFSPVRGLDLTPFAVALSTCIFGFTLIRLRFMDIVPVARSLMVERMSDGIMVLDDMGRLVDINPAARLMLSMAEKESIGKPLDEAWNQWASIDSGVKKDGAYELNIDIEGRKAIIDVTVTPLFKERGKTVLGRLVVLRDVTQRRTMEIALRDEVTRRTNYTRALVHELKTPLTAIIASSELLKMEVSKNTRAFPLTQNIWRSSQNLDMRINELLDLARSEVGTLTVKPDELDIPRLISEVTWEITPLAKKKGLDLVVETPPNLPTALADESRIRQVLLNLINNAVKFAEQGQVTAKASIDSQGMILIQVTDTGLGITAEDLDRIFDPYWQRPNDRESLSGMGIGLALCKIFVELHHGRMWVNSQPGKGSEFCFTLPAYHKLD